MTRSTTFPPARLLPFALSVFLGAFLLFLVQPIVARVLLPRFGGGASIWSVCLVFFQTVLFLGYFYAHWIAQNLGVKRQLFLHLGLIGVSLPTLFFLNHGWLPPSGVDPALGILALLFLMVGLPYFTLSATGPLFQSWLARTFPDTASSGLKKRPHDTPYWLFALSNTGSLLALFSYPLIIEPTLTLHHQLNIWTIYYLGFAIVSFLVVLQLKSHISSTDLPAEENTDSSTDSPPSLRRKALWLLLSACPSVLLLAVTNHLTRNITPMPLLWMLELGLYLLSFIICFTPAEWRWSKSFLPIPALSIAGVFLLIIMPDLQGIRSAISIFSVGLFVACLVCHGELARMKPHHKHLTSFYLMISLGGAAGGIFVGLIAPRIFDGFYELQIGLGVYAILAWTLFYREEKGRPGLSWVILGTLTLWLVWFMAQEVLSTNDNILYMARNFYGALTVNRRTSDRGEPMRSLLNGTILHGAEFTAPGRRRLPTTYYSPDSGIGLTLRATQSSSPRKVGVIGLGVGTLAAYGRPGDTYRFYEIDPLVEKVAQNQFHFLHDSPAHIEIAIGDGRILLQRENKQNFDILVVDAFAGDVVPVHLLTREAFALYFSHLKPDGILAVHVSSLYMSLSPIVKLAAESFGKHAMQVFYTGNPDNFAAEALWVLIPSNPNLFSNPLFRGKTEEIQCPDKVTLWTDDYSNIFRSLNID